MKFRPRDMADSVIRKLRANSEFVKIVVLPAVVFSLDLVLRSVMNINLIDAGADMALLGVSTFITLVVEGSHKDDVTATIVFVIVFMLFWIGCLKIVSLNTLPLLSPLTSYDFRGVSSWFFGLMAFILSGIFADSLIRNAKPGKQGTNL